MSKLAPSLTGDYILKLDNVNAGVTQSLSPCPNILQEHTPFLPDSFQHSTPSPGSENICSQQGQSTTVQTAVKGQDIGGPPAKQPRIEHSGDQEMGQAGLTSNSADGENQDNGNQGIPIHQ